MSAIKSSPDQLKKKLFLYLFWVIALIYSLWPQQIVVPVAGASARDWNPQSFWFEPWGASGVHKGIDIFAREKTPVVSSVYGVVLYAGTLGRGGNVVVVLTTQWRVHYFAHLRDIDVAPGQPVAKNRRLGTVGTSGNAAGKPAHLHYSVITLIPYPWRWDFSTQGWKKMFFLDPTPEATRSVQARAWRGVVLWPLRYFLAAIICKSVDFDVREFKQA